MLNWPTAAGGVGIGGMPGRIRRFGRRGALWGKVFIIPRSQCL